MNYCNEVMTTCDAAVTAFMKTMANFMKTMASMSGKPSTFAHHPTKKKLLTAPARSLLSVAACR